MTVLTVVLGRRHVSAVVVVVAGGVVRVAGGQGGEGGSRETSPVL